MASNCQFERLLPLLALAGVGVGVIIAISSPVSRKRFSVVALFQKRKEVHEVYYVEEPTSPKENYITGLPNSPKENYITDLPNSPKENYISRLPDDILCHIISSLGMKDAVRTSVLSRRWRKLYCTMPNPKFECPKMFENNCHHRYKQRFVTFVGKMFEFVNLTKHNDWHRNYKQQFVTVVDTYLCLRSGLPMESLTLRFGLMIEFPEHLRRWLNCVLRTGVRKLDLNFCCNDELLKIPDSKLIEFPFKVLLGARMLEYVQLSSCILEPNFQGSFNSLKELILHSVPLVKGEVESILSSCPQLRLLNLRYCELPCRFRVNALELRTLKIFCCEQVNEITLSAPNLDYFAYSGKSTISFSHSYVPNLGKLCLGLECDNRLPYGSVGFVRSAPCLHTLWIQATPYQVQFIRSEMPTPWNVHWLSLHVIKESLDLQDIISLIALCPNLTRFDLSSHLCSLKYTERDEEVPLTRVHLKHVALDGFKFYAAQKKFASHLIRCAPALEEMNIYIPYCFYARGRIAEKTLPLERRVFSNELIRRTKQQLQQQASSPSASVKFFID